MYYLHPSEKLVELYSKRPYQGARPEDSEFLFIGLDANFSHKIENTPLFSVIKEYLQNGVAFWEKYGVHHPFRLPEYSGDGNLYHSNFSKIGFTPTHSSKVSFIEIIDVPTIGVSNLSKEDLNIEHMEYLNKLITSGTKRYVFLPSMVANLMRSTKKFNWLKSKSQGSYRNIPLWAKIGETVIFKTYHLSYRYDPEGMKKQLKILSSIVKEG